MEKLSKNKKCSICGKEYDEYGNNAQPINDGICCDFCNENVVIPARIWGKGYLNEQGRMA